MADLATLLDEVAAQDLAGCQAPDGSLHIPALRRHSRNRQRNALRYWVRRGGLRAPSAKTLDHILEHLARTPQTRHCVVAWPEAEIRRYRDRLELLARRGAPQPFEFSWTPPRPLDLPGQSRRLAAVATLGAGLSQERTGAGSVIVRSRRGGELCRLAGRTHHTKLKKLLQAAGVPPWERARLPLVYVDGALAAIGDRWVCEPFQARPSEPAWRIVLEPRPTTGG
jgi:tRNA(Ile)-lysidine synthase